MAKATYEGACGIKATVIANSVSSTSNTEIITFELEYPRFILSELNTHRVFSRNSASSRAIPIEKMLEHLKATPVHWGKNQSGMQAKEELSGDERVVAMSLWEKAKQDAMATALEMHKVGLHKQVANRILEPFQMMKTVVTATEWENFFELRRHLDAQPEIQELAECMYKAVAAALPVILEEGDWHLPYVGEGRWRKNESNEYGLIDSIILSISQCAQVSYRKTDDTLDKAYAVFNRLLSGEPRHASPCEHQATPMFDHALGNMTFHQEREGWSSWSGNFRDWVQFRQVLEALYKE